MSKEQPQPTEPFAFTEHERLWERISDGRFKALLDDTRTAIHKVQLDSNSYGEFLFITVSRSEAGTQQALTFYGYGFHEYRERWYTGEWAWYEADPLPRTLDQRLTREEAEGLLQARREEIAPYAHENTQTHRGRLYEMLADLTDEDGAWAELEDLGDAADWLLADESGIDTGEADDPGDDLPRTKPMFDGE